MANKYLYGTKDRISTVRLRTWSLTIAVIVTVVFYFLVTIATKQEVNLIDFAFLCTVQIIMYCTYFPDGDKYGQKNQCFIDNKATYNDKATDINTRGRIHKLREFCKYEYAERKELYIQNSCGAIGISVSDLEQLKKLTEKEIKKLKKYEFVYINKETNEKESKFAFFDRAKRKKIYELLFKELPISPNYPETIMSALENNGSRAITDGSLKYRKGKYISKLFTSVVIGGIFAYIGYVAKDGIGIEEVVSALMYLTSMFTTAVFAFSSGETCSSVYKNRFYIELSNFIDAFNEWDKKGE